MKYVSSSALTEAISLRVEDKTEDEGQRVKTTGMYALKAAQRKTLAALFLFLESFTRQINFDIMAPFFCSSTQLEGDITKVYVDSKFKEVCTQIALEHRR